MNALHEKTQINTAASFEAYHVKGHQTIEGILNEREVELLIADALEWEKEQLESLSEDEKRWYVDRGSKLKNRLRKLDHPVFHRSVFKAIARDPRIIHLVESVIGKGVVCPFSQIFFKPPFGGGPKPVHQDDHYFGPSIPGSMITLWLALDDATVENGCLHYAEGSHLQGLVEHIAPEDEPFNLQVAAHQAGKYPMVPAPVSKGGLSLHHGRVMHQSSDNQTPSWRRAVAFHFLHHEADLRHAVLPYPPEEFVELS